MQLPTKLKGLLAANAKPINIVVAIPVPARVVNTVENSRLYVGNAEMNIFKLQSCSKSRYNKNLCNFRNLLFGKHKSDANLLSSSSKYRIECLSQINQAQINRYKYRHLMVG